MIFRPSKKLKLSSIKKTKLIDCALECRKTQTYFLSNGKNLNWQSELSELKNNQIEPWSVEENQTDKFYLSSAISRISKIQTDKLSFRLPKNYTWQNELLSLKITDGHTELLSVEKTNRLSFHVSKFQMGKLSFRESEKLNLSLKKSEKLTDWAF